MVKLWESVYKILIAIINGDNRWRCIDLAADVLYGFLHHSSAEWNVNIWESYCHYAIDLVFSINEVFSI